MTISELNEKFAMPGVLEFDEHNGLTRVQVKMASAQATVYLHGAHLTHWQPVGTKPVLFLSEQSEFADGKAIRGGVPICFPWFGARSDGGSGPSHGFARLQPWDLAFAALVPGESGDQMYLTFTLFPTDLSRSLGFDNFRVAYEVIVGKTLTLRLTVANSSAEPLRFEEALHSYFAIGDVRQTTLTGLEAATYLDKPDGMKVKTTPADALRFTAETDRVFPANVAATTIHDPVNGRTITVEKTNSATTVVWNPWNLVAAKLADLPDDAWPDFLCVETANTGTDAIMLEPGATYAMTATVSVAAL